MWPMRGLLMRSIRSTGIQAIVGMYGVMLWRQESLLTLKNSLYRNGWGATIADALTTAIMMKQGDIVMKQLKFMTTIDFSVVGPNGSTEVSVFETTVGELLSNNNESLHP